VPEIASKSLLAMEYANPGGSCPLVVHTYVHAGLVPEKRYARTPDEYDWLTTASGRRSGVMPRSGVGLVPPPSSSQPTRPIMTGTKRKHKKSFVTDFCMPIIDPSFRKKD
jgi:hypothetical protein